MTMIKTLQKQNAPGMDHLYRLYTTYLDSKLRTVKNSRITGSIIVHAGCSQKSKRRTLYDRVLWMQKRQNIQ